MSYCVDFVVVFLSHCGYPLALYIYYSTNRKVCQAVLGTLRRIFLSFLSALYRPFPLIIILLFLRRDIKTPPKVTLLFQVSTLGGAYQSQWGFSILNLMVDIT